jgi:hypothetical protein
MGGSLLSLSLSQKNTHNSQKVQYRKKVLLHTYIHTPKKISDKTFGGQFWRGLGRKKFHTTHKKYCTEIATRRECKLNATS